MSPSLQKLFKACRTVESVSSLYLKVKHYEGAYEYARTRILELMRAEDEATDIITPFSEDVSTWYEIKLVKKHHSKRFNIWAEDFTLKVKPLPYSGVKTCLPILLRLFEHIFDNIASSAKPHSLIRIILQNDQLRYPIALATASKETLNAAMFFQALSNVLQSYMTFSLEYPITINVIKFPAPPKAGGKRKRSDVVIEDYLKNKRCIISVRRDGLCAARALVLGKALADGLATSKDKRLWRSLMLNDPRSDNVRQRELAMELYQRAGVHPGRVKLSDFSCFQRVLPNYQITIYSSPEMDGILFQGPGQPLKINIFLQDEHCSVIKSLAPFFGKKRQCKHCLKWFAELGRHHRCPLVCYVCQKVGCRRTPGSKQYCVHCNKDFNNDDCFKAHTMIDPKDGLSLCRRSYICKDCGMAVSATRKRENSAKHVCYEYYCKNCSLLVPQSHTCFIRPYCREPKRGQRFIYADFESSIIDGDSHKPIAAVAMYEDGETFEFFGAETENSFCNWLFNRKHKNYIAIFHNLSGYDCSFLLSYLHKQKIRPQILTRGLKVLQIVIPEIGMTIRDSLAFLPMSLASMPKSFGFDADNSKLYFPHLFSKSENLEYVGPIPGKTFFLTHQMKFEDLEKFESWHESQVLAGKEWNYRSELLDYCTEDVQILRKACKLFCDNMRNLTSFCPFTETATLAAFVNLVLRAKYLKPDTIQLLPKESTAIYRNTSKESLEWLYYMENKLGTPIRHGRNNPKGEKKISKYSLDGFIEPNIILEYHGCNFHGHPDCFDSDAINSNGERMGDLFARTEAKKKFFTSRGYAYHEMWSCTWKKFKATDHDCQDILSSYCPVTPLNPREAMSGGRVEAFNLLKVPKEGEWISFKDVNSLYPFVCKGSHERPFPVGLPEIILNNFKGIEDYFGIARVSILPPRGLKLPVLQCKINKKAFYCLCPPCAEEERDGGCPHSDEERIIEGVFTTPELLLAIKKGYEIKKIFEVWHYPERSPNLFEEFVKNFYRLKIMNSGFPRGCNTLAEKQAYVDRLRMEGLDLKVEDISYNPTQRLLCKLMCNSMWGRFALRSNLAKFEYVTKVERLSEILYSGFYDVDFLNILDDDTIQIQHTRTDDSEFVDLKSNVIIASFVTSYARMILYENMDIVGADRLIYTDTDSIVALEGPGLPTIPCGDLLGQFQSELDDDDCIEYWACSGAKSYIYRTKKNKEVVKMKGLTMCHSNRDIFRLDRLQELIRDPTIIHQVLNPYKIFRIKGSWTMKTGPQSKLFRYTFNKRQLLPTFETRPYGFFQI
jgi:hypothetical protein